MVIYYVIPHGNAHAMNGISMFEAAGYFKPFPDYPSVFHDNPKLHRKYLLPLATVELSFINSAWDGQVHFVTPLIQIHREMGGRYDTYLCRERWIGFKLIENRLKLACDFKFFNVDYDKEVMKKANDGYSLRKKHHLEFQSLHNAWAKRTGGTYSQDDRVELVRSLGGESFHCNWSAATDFPIIDGSMKTDECGDLSTTAYPMTEDGRPFSFIGTIPIHHYIAQDPDYTCLLDGNVMLFYDPEDKLALTTVALS